MKEDETVMASRQNDPWADDVSKKLRDLSDEVNETKKSLADLQSSIYELMAIVEMGRGFFHTCAIVGMAINKMAKWLAPIIGVIGGIYAIFQHWFSGK